jgi:hypothetical protein
MSSFRRAVSVVSRGTGTYVDGIYVEAVGATITYCQASIQPTSERAVLALPEGRREKKSFTLYSDTSLVSLGQAQNPDRVILFGEEYEVIKKEEWQNNVINHYKYIVVKV